MNNLLALKKTLMLLVLLGITVSCLGQKTTMWTAESANKWLHQNEWRNGLKLEIHPSVNKIEFADQYHKNQALWDKVFAFLKDSDLVNLKPGKYVIEGDNAYALITEAPSKTQEQAAWESHKKYIDLQYVIKGREKIGVTPLSAATVTKPYDEEKDYANYAANGEYYIADPGIFFLFFPDDVHRPNIKVDGFDIVKKLVIKIRVAE